MACATGLEPVPKICGRELMTWTWAEMEPLVAIHRERSRIVALVRSLPMMERGWAEQAIELNDGGKAAINTATLLSPAIGFGSRLGWRCREV